MKTYSIILPLLAFCSTAIATPGQGYDNRPKIEVNGGAIMHVTPNNIEITLTIYSADKHLKDARAHNRKAAAAASETVEKLADQNMKIVKTGPIISLLSAISTSKLSKGGSRPTVTSHIIINVAKADRAAEIADALLEHGGVEIKYKHTQINQYLSQIRQDALKAAKKKAETMAKTAGYKSVSAVMISENKIGRPWYYYNDRLLHRRSFTGLSTKPAGIFTDVEDVDKPGKITIRSSVKVTFQMNY